MRKDRQKVSRSIQVVASAVLLLGFATTQARAELVVALGKATLSNGMGTMDITVTSNDNDTLSAFGLELLITGPTLPQFTAAQSDPFGNTNYVFAGQSFNQDNGLPLWSAPYTTNYQFDTISGGDQSDSTQGFVVVPSTPGALNTYLATVQFEVQQSDQFQITLVQDPNFTYFDDSNGNPLKYTFGSVPEPSSLTLAALASLGGLPCWWRRRRTRQS